jgi:protease-4
MSEIEPVAAPPPPPPPQTAAPAPRQKSRAGIFFIGAFSGCLLVFAGLLFFGFLAAAFSNNDNTTGEWKFGTNKVAVVPLEGEIFEARDFVDLLHRYADNSMVRAIVIRINSPGGAIAPSQEMYEEIRKTRRRSGKPIVASLDSVAASGGYYVAAACDKIVANPGSITGSIGVIMQWMDFQGLLDWAKTKPQTITSGAMKDAGSPYREMTDAERGYFQHIAGELHHQFIAAVAKGRKLSEADVVKVADGRIFTGEEALSLKLVDQLGNLDDAVTAAAKLAGVSGRPTTIYPRKRKRGLFDLLSSDQETESFIERFVTRRTANFLYHW